MLHDICGLGFGQSETIAKYNKKSQTKVVQLNFIIVLTCKKNSITSLGVILPFFLAVSLVRLKSCAIFTGFCLLYSVCSTITTSKILEVVILCIGSILPRLHG